jgi:PadR family transcriptional regulator AphA
VAHVRDLRTQLLLRLRLLDRRGADLSELADAQVRQLRPVLTSLKDQARATEGFDHLLAAWRYESAEAALRVLEDVLAGAAPSRGQPAAPRRG